MAKLNNISAQINKQVIAAIKSLPPVLGNEAVNWSKGNFTRQGYPGADGFKKWAARKSDKKGIGRAIMVKSGRLKRGIRKLQVSGLVAYVGVVGVPYAKAHNEGLRDTVNIKEHRRAKSGTIRVSTGRSDKPFKNKKTTVGYSTVRAHSRRINLPQRKFLGASPVLASILRRKAIVHLGKNIKF